MKEQFENCIAPIDSGDVDFISKKLGCGLLFHKQLEQLAAMQNDPNAVEWDRAISRCVSEVIPEDPSSATRIAYCGDPTRLTLQPVPTIATPSATTAPASSYDPDLDPGTKYGCVTETLPHGKLPANSPRWT